MTPKTYISISRRIHGGYRVVVKRFSGDLNSVDATLAEQICRTKTEARRVVKAAKDTWTLDHVQGELLL